MDIVDCLNGTLCDYYRKGSSGELNININENILNNNASSTYSKDGHIVSRKTLIKVMPLFVTSFFIILVNLRVICVVIDSPRRKLRTISILIANLSSICVGLVFYNVIYTVEKLNVVGFGSQPICIFLSFGRNIVGAAFPINIVAIIYERVSAFWETERKLLPLRTIVFIWVVAAVSSIPTIFWIRYEFNLETQLGRCKQINLFGSFLATVAFGVWRLFLLYILVTGYMFWALFRIRSKLKFLYLCTPILSSKLRNTVRRLRFIYFYTIFFTLIWLPIGISLFIVSVSGRAGVKYKSIEPWVALMLSSNYIFMGFSPFLFALLYDNMSTICSPIKCGCTKPNNNGDIVNENNADGLPMDSNIRHGENSSNV